jgi:hypothetical protein
MSISPYTRILKVNSKPVDNFENHGLIAYIAGVATGLCIYASVAAVHAQIAPYIAGVATFVFFAALVVFALSAFNILVTNAKAAKAAAAKEAARRAEVDKFWSDQRAAYKAVCDEIRAYDVEQAARAKVTAYEAVSDEIRAYDVAGYKAALVALADADKALKAAVEKNCHFGS